MVRCSGCAVGGDLCVRHPVARRLRTIPDEAEADLDGERRAGEGLVRAFTCTRAESHIRTEWVAECRDDIAVALSDVCARGGSGQWALDVAVTTVVNISALKRRNGRVHVHGGTWRRTEGGGF